MYFIEAPSIENIERRLTYSPIKWLSKTKFLQILDDENSLSFGPKVHPQIDTLDNETSICNKIFIGRSIANYEYGALPELLGTVSKNLTNNDWQLSVSYSSAVHVIKDDFLVLNIEDPRAFEWRTTTYDNIPNNGLRGAIDESANEYLYIGRTIVGPNGDDSSPKSYRWPNWIDFNEPLPHMFGKVHRSHKCLYVPVNELELNVKKYDILCLLPSAASLKCLCRLKIRQITQNNNKRMIEINQNKRRLPERLISFIKNPSFLQIGDYLLKGEKLVDNLNDFELYINEEDQLIYHQINNKEIVKQNGTIFSNNNYYIRHHYHVNVNRNSQNSSKSPHTIIIRNNVNSIWLHPFKIIFLDKNNRLNFWKLPQEHQAQSAEVNKEYKFIINNLTTSPDDKPCDIVPLD
jgi:hypothetical protein